MTATQLIAKLDAAATAFVGADGRRILSSEAATLRARVQRADQAAALRRALDKLPAQDTSLQAEAQRADLRAQLARLGNTDVAAQMVEAQRVLEMWT